MQEIKKDERRVVNIYEGEYRPFIGEDGTNNGDDVLQINSHEQLGVGFHVYRMAPGMTTTPHEHTGDEEFLILEGEIEDNDGTVYRKGDLVWLKKGTEHCSYTKDGALLAVYIPTPEKSIG